MTADAKFYAETPDGYLVASISREHGYFSVTGEIHGSRRGYELGVDEPHTCGCIHDEILRNIPQLAPIVRMHLADVQTGEPMHFRWKSLSAAAAETMRAQHQKNADEVNALVDAMETDVSDPADVWDEEEFSIELDAGLSITAKLLPELGHRDAVGSYYRYEVKISAPGKNGRRHSYTTTFGASVADYNEGRFNAREAAFGTARELLTFEYETARDFIEETCGESWDDLPAEQRRALKASEQAFDHMSDALVANREKLGG